MQPITINIPSKLTPRQNEWVDGWIRIVRKAGVDPRRLAAHAMGEAIFRGWIRGEHTEADVLRMLRNLAILNPGLSAGA